MYDCYFTNVLTQRSCFEVLLTADSQCFSLATMLVYSYRRSLDEDGRSLRVGTPRSSFTASSVVNFFSPGAPVVGLLNE